MQDLLGEQLLGVVFHVGEQLLHDRAQGRDLVVVGAVDVVVRGLLVGGDVALFTAAHIGPHAERVGSRRAAEVVVAHGPADHAQPHAVKDLLILVEDVGCRGDKEPRGLRVAVGEHGVQAVDALKDHGLVFVQLQGRALFGDALALEVVVGHQDLLAPVERAQVLVEQIDAQGLGGLEIQLTVGRSGEAVVGLHAVVVVERDHVAVDAALLQRPADAGGGGGLAGGGGACQQDDAAQVQPGDHGVGRLFHAVGIGLVTALDKADGVLADGFVDQFKLYKVFSVHSWTPFNSRNISSFCPSTSSIFSMYSLGNFGLWKRSSFVCERLTLLMPAPPRETMLCSSSIM